MYILLSIFIGILSTTGGVLIFFIFLLFMGCEFEGSWDTWWPKNDKLSLASFMIMGSCFIGGFLITYSHFK